MAKAALFFLASSLLICAGETPLCYRTGPLARQQAGSMLGKQQNPGARLSLACPLSSSSLVAILFILIHFLFRDSAWAGPEGILTNLSSKHNYFLFCQPNISSSFLTLSSSNSLKSNCTISKSSLSFISTIEKYTTC